MSRHSSLMSTFVPSRPFRPVPCRAVRFVARHPQNPTPSKTKERNTKGKHHQQRPTTAGAQEGSKKHSRGRGGSMRPKTGHKTFICRQRTTSRVSPSIHSFATPPSSIIHDPPISHNEGGQEQFQHAYTRHASQRSEAKPPKNETAVPALWKVESGRAAVHQRTSMRRAPPIKDQHGNTPPPTQPPQLFVKEPKIAP